MARKSNLKSDEIENDWPLDDEESADLSPHHVGGEKYRMIDWIQSFGVVGVVIILALPALAFAAQTFHSIFISSTVLLIFIFLVPIVGVIQFKGYLFDPSQNTLSYPVYIYRRSIPISEIRNANCQTVSGRSTSDFARVIGESRPVTTYYKTYKVNVSGRFGVRPITFAAKYKRDQFLSILRMVAPQCRITRWS